MIYLYINRQKGNKMIKIVTAEDIIKAHKIQSAKAYGSVVLVNNIYGTPFSFHYSDSKIAKAVAKKVSMFVGV